MKLKSIKEKPKTDDYEAVVLAVGHDEYKDMKGFSVRNLKYMRQFASNYPDFTIVQELLAQLSWYHNLTIMQKVKDINVEFKPEFVGKLNFYLSAVDDLVKSENDNPTIGLILCKSKDKIEAEYSLKDISKPIGISEYQITKSIPSELKSKLPSIKDIEKQLENE